ncbi:glycosyltransferase [Tenacibaculum sp. UWU-22]|uniref:glycosyltransferase n=1 Tax=Tenacibaculum sp. UWU-22 TaxID=3234187 RepID=UPI0034DAC392
MTTKNHITASIVLYKEPIDALKKAINSFLNTPLKKKLYLIDNSPTNTLKAVAVHPDIEYIFVGKNIGFSKAHNRIIKWIESDYHLILNPDVEFAPQVIPNLISQLETKNNVAMIAPKVVFPNGLLQYSCRKYPSPSDLIIRRLGIFKSKIYDKEYRNQDLSKPFYPDSILGCFMLFKTKDFLAIKGFDERYFLYLEDIDICKKIDALQKKKYYYPQEQITHIYRRNSAKEIYLFMVHLISAVKYFNKWLFL